MFAKPGGQRVIATHSATVVRSFHPSHVLALTGMGPRQLNTTAATTNSKFFSRWWVEDMIEPLVSRSLILVEGPSDAIITRAVATLRGIDLDREDITVVALGSACDFPNAYKLFGPDGFNIKVTSVVDRREAHYPASALGVDEGELDAHDVIVCDPDLEHVYVSALGQARVVQLLLESGLGFVGVNEANVVARCGGQNKVKAALAVHSGMSGGEAASITPMSVVVDRAMKRS